VRIAFFSQRVPYPPNRGDKITTYNEVAFLARRHEVEIFCMGDGPEDLEYAEALRAKVGRVHVEPTSPLAGRLRILCSLLNGKPFTLEYFGSTRLKRAFAARHAEQRFDVALVYSSSMAQFVEDTGDLGRVMQFADLDSLKWAQYARHSRGPLRWLYAREARRLLEYERHIARSSAHSLVCTHQELGDLNRLIPGAPASCVANGVDLEYFQPQPDVPKLRGNLVFTGVMDYRPNVDAVRWFARDILPRIQETVPAASFTICGARPSREVLALASLKGVEVTGRVEDVRPYLARAQAGVVPLRMARGIQNKLLEAMAMGLACVITPETAAGLEPAAVPAIRIGRTAAELAAAAVELLQDPEQAARLGSEARRKVAELYRWDTQLAKLERILEAARR